MQEVGAGDSEGTIVGRAFGKYDFAYNTLSSKAWRNGLNHPQSHSTGRGAYISNGGFYVFGRPNRYGDALRGYNIHDAGNFLFANASKRDGYGLRTLLYGADINERFNLRNGDTIADRMAMIYGYNHGR